VKIAKWKMQNLLEALNQFKIFNLNSALCIQVKTNFSKG